MPGCLCRPTGFTSFKAQVRGLIAYLKQSTICPKSGTAFKSNIGGKFDIILTCIFFSSTVL
jgi:hypothetical protein